MGQYLGIARSKSYQKYTATHRETHSPFSMNRPAHPGTDCKPEREAPGLPDGVRREAVTGCTLKVPASSSKAGSVSKAGIEGQPHSCVGEGRKPSIPRKPRSRAALSALRTDGGQGWRWLRRGGQGMQTGPQKRTECRLFGQEVRRQT